MIRRVRAATLWLAAAVWFGCRAPAPRTTKSMEANDLETNLRMLSDPVGGAPHLRRREQAIRYLLDHADQAHPRILEALRSNPKGLNAPVLMEVLPRFGRPESVPLLEEILLLNIERLSGPAGQALGRHPAAGARDSLLRGLRSNQAYTRMGAIDGLMIRGDRSVCPELKIVTRNEEPDTRYRAIRAAGVLGCLSADELGEIQRSDPDPDIRRLAGELASRQP